MRQNPATRRWPRVAACKPVSAAALGNGGKDRVEGTERGVKPQSRDIHKRSNWCKQSRVPIRARLLHHLPFFARPFRVIKVRGYSAKNKTEQ